MTTEDRPSADMAAPARAEMERAIACLALELPAEVWEDVRNRWWAARDAMTSENERLRALTVDDPTSIYHEHEQLRQIILRHDADREMGRCDGLLMSQYDGPEAAQ